MSLKDELNVACKSIYSDAWDVTNKYVVPAPADLRLDNHAGFFDEMTVLYADMNGSTAMVDSRKWQFSAEVYKAYLHCAAKIIKAQGGVITAYDGDRIMAVFTGDNMESEAVRAGLKINWAVQNIVNPTMRPAWDPGDFVARHSIGIDKSPIHVARIGVKNDNDLVWVGRAANHAAKLTNVPEPARPIWISLEVLNALDRNLLTYGSTGDHVWQSRPWREMHGQNIYGTNAVIELI